MAGGRYWIGKEVRVAPSPITLGEARRILAWAKNFIWQRRIQKIFHPKGVSSPEVTAQAMRGSPQMQRGRGLVRRADKYSAQLMAKGYTHHHQPRVEETMATAGYFSEEDQYESALDRGSDGVYDSDTASPYDESDDEELGDDIVEYDTETSHLITVAERNRQRRKQKQWCNRQERQRQRQRREKGATLPLFKNSQKEGATTYIDWRNDMDELIQDKLDSKRIRSLVMQSLEGAPKDMAKLVYKKGKGTLCDILATMDKTYGWSTSFVHLQSELCNITQAYRELAQDYYERLVRLQVAIQDKYPGRLKDHELERMAQEAFYSGLRDEYKPLVVHLLENPAVTVNDLVEAVRNIEANQEQWQLQRLDAARYPPSTSQGYNKPTFGNNKDKDKKEDRLAQTKPVPIHAKPAQYESDHSPEDSDDNKSADEEALWRDSYYYYAIHQVDDTKGFFNACYNCRETGHRWQHCPKPLRQALQEIKDRVGRNGDRLNGSGDGGRKGADVPEKGQGSVMLAKIKKQ